MSRGPAGCSRPRAAAGVPRLVVFSSMSAFEGTEQIYGRAKLRIEEVAREVGAVSLRPGLVYGPTPGGMAGTLLRLSRLPVVPLVGGRAHQFTVHEDDFADAVTALVGADRPGTEPIGVANPVPVQFRRLIEGLARTEGRRPRFLPVDWRIAYRGLVAAESLGVPLPVRADSLLGLVRAAPSVPNLDVLDALGVRLRRFGQPVPPGLQQS